jgi:3-oxoacyl-[acyl-carrier protein] reductase
MSIKSSEGKGLVMLVTGARIGIGRNLVEYYTAKGLKVIGCSRTPSDYEHSNYQHLCVDVSKEEDVENLFRTIKSIYKRLDILVNNAGRSSENFASYTSRETVQNVLNTNTVGSILCCREAIRLMRKNKFGRIINFSSIHVPLATIGTSAYSASKAAIVQFSRVFAREVYSLGITVNNLELSVVESSGMAESLSEEVLLQILGKTITKSYIQPEEVCYAVDFLASEKADKITGHTLTIGGI